MKFKGFLLWLLAVSGLLAVIVCLDAVSPKKPTPVASVAAPTQSPTPIASATQNTFGLPKPTCGDPAVGGDEKWYGVFIDGGNINTVRAKYCGDAIATTRQTTGKASIQVASFTDKNRAEAFAAAVGGEASDYDPKTETTVAEKPSPEVTPSASKDEPETTNPSTRTAKAGYLAALSEKELDQAIGYVAQKDDAALQELLSDGRVVILKSDLQVYLEDCSNLLCSIAKVRPVGQTVTFYMVREAISK